MLCFATVCSYVAISASDNPFFELFMEGLTWEIFASSHAIAWEQNLIKQSLFFHSVKNLDTYSVMIDASSLSWSFKAINTSMFQALIMS